MAGKEIETENNAKKMQIYNSSSTDRWNHVRAETGEHPSFSPHV